MFLSTLFKSPAIVGQNTEIEFQGHVIKITRKPIKTLRLKMHPHTAALSMSIPHHAKASDITAFLHKNVQWISQQKQRLESRSKDHTQPGTHLSLWGQEIAIEYLTDTRMPAVQLSDGKLMIQADLTDAKRTRKIEQFYRESLQKELHNWQTLWPEKLGVTPQFTGIRKMHTKWGSCYIQKRRIWLSLELAKYPKRCAEMVYVHELVHLLEAKHNRRFYKLMTEFMPDWREWDNILRES